MNEKIFTNIVDEQKVLDIQDYIDEQNLLVIANFYKSDK